MTGNSVEQNELNSKLFEGRLSSCLIDPVPLNVASRLWRLNKTVLICMTEIFFLTERCSVSYH